MAKPTPTDAASLRQLITCLRTAEKASQLLHATNIVALLRATRRAVAYMFPGSTESLDDTEAGTEDSVFFIDSHQSGVYLPNTLRSFAQSPAFQGQGYAPHIVFNPDTLKTDLRLFTLHDDPQVSYESQTDILRGKQGDDQYLACVQPLRIDDDAGFPWPSFSYDDPRPSMQQACEAVDAFVARTRKDGGTTTASFSTGAHVRLHNPTSQHPGERLEELSIQPEFPDYTQVCFHIVAKDGVTGFHIEDNGLRSFNLCHIGYKAWVIIPDGSRDAFEQYVMRRLGLPASVRSQLCDQFVRHLGILCSPTQLEEAAVEYRIVVQGPGEFVATTPLEYHMVLGLTSSIATSNNFIYRDDPDIVAALENAKVCEQCGNYPLIRDYNVNHSTTLGSHVATVQALIRQLEKPTRECSIEGLTKRDIDASSTGNENVVAKGGDVPLHDHESAIRKGGGFDTTSRKNVGSGTKRSTLSAEANLAKRKRAKLLPPSATDGTAGQQGHATVVASSCLQSLPRREPASRKRTVCAAAKDVNQDQRAPRGHSKRRGVSGIGDDETTPNTTPGTSPRTNPDATTVTTLTTPIRHSSLSQFDAFYLRNPLSRDQLVALPAHDRCGLAAVLHTKQHLEDFFAAVKDQNNRFKGKGVSDLENALSSRNSSHFEDPATGAIRSAIIEMVRSNRHRLGKQKADYRQRFFCYLARRLWEEARVETSPWGSYKAMGGGQVRLDPAVRDRLTRQLLPVECAQSEAAEVSGYVGAVMHQGFRWNSLAKDLGMGIIALIPYRRKELHVLNVSAGYYYNGLHGESSLPRLREFQAALDTPYMNALLNAAESLANAIVHNNDVHFAFNDYQGDKPISSLSEHEICRLLKTVPSKDIGHGNAQSSPSSTGVISKNGCSSTNDKGP
ncbi:hypothetical protein FPOAC1_003867 [Fusarium poae]|uniref:hypothetical protein n=1 Tax=Fusarium poae TaxID=36050 RepID=UPI001CE88048|nr:hypothetical protein FPOAC1_003867 [Fusarium poae]KAG8677839.1 hypothetical protein FPOAC1_003867 [Fusarium poae]